MQHTVIVDECGYVNDHANKCNLVKCLRFVEKLTIVCAVMAYV